MKKDIREISLDEIKDYCISNGMKKYVSSQVYSWLWKKSCVSFDDMTNLSLSNRELFNKKFTINTNVDRICYHKCYFTNNEEGYCDIVFNIMSCFLKEIAKPLKTTDTHQHTFTRIGNIGYSDEV